MKILIIFVCLLSSINLFTQYDLKWITPRPVFEGVNDISILNENTAMAVGENGLIMRTSDSGNNWVIINRDSSKVFKKLFFTDVNIGYLYGLNDIINEHFFLLKTTDGGFNWTDLNIQNLNPILDIYFLNSNTGFLSFFGNVYYRTDNGGMNWDSVYLNIGNNPNWLHQIYFINSSTGFIAADIYDQYSIYGKLLKTTDTGNSWSYIYNDTGNFYRNLKFFNDTTGYILKNSYLMKTTNSGDSWSFFRDLSENVVYGFQQTKFIDENNFLIATDYYYWNRINKTTDAGMTWSTTVTDGYSIDCIDVFNNFALAGGSFGNLLKSTDFGSNWVNYNEMYSEMSKSFADKYGNIFMGGEFGNLFKSSDYGNDWAKLNLYTDTVQSYLLPSVYFLNSNTGFYFGEKCRFYRTTDKGSSWIRLLDTCTQYSSAYYSNIYFINQSTGFLAGGRYLYGYSLNIILKTTDSGLTWQEITNNAPYSESNLFFEDINTGYVGNYFGLWKTTNGGINWNNINNDGEFGKCYFQNSSNFFKIDNNKFYKSTDSGLSWLFLYQPDNYEIIIDFCILGVNLYLLIEEQTISGYNKIAKSDNYGASWHSEIISQRYNLNKIQMFDDYTGYLFGSFGRLLKIIDMKSYSGSGNIPYKFLLYQNFPNPFNPVSTIKYEIPKTDFTVLLLYDVLGREVKKIVNQVETAGIHQIEYNFSNLSSGIYFLQLRQGNYSQSRKMVLIK